MGNLVTMVYDHLQVEGEWYEIHEFGSSSVVRVMQDRSPVCKICGDLDDHFGRPHTERTMYGTVTRAPFPGSFARTKAEAQTYAERYLQRLRGEAY